MIEKKLIETTAICDHLHSNKGAQHVQLWLATQGPSGQEAWETHLEEPEIGGESTEYWPDRLVWDSDTSHFL
jgi:hypothetical protein